VSQIDADGCVIACWDDERVRRVIGGCGRRIVKFGLGDGLDVSATDVDINSPQPSYTLMKSGEPVGKITLGVPGIQNVIDSLAAAAVAFEMGVDFNSIADALSEFTGAGRRFEVLHNGGVMVVDDYAHHPAEVKATLCGTRAAYDRNLIAVFQPHLYSRTKAFTNEFAEALSVADEVIVTSIYAARELPIEGVTAEGIVDRLKSLGHENATYWPDRVTLASELSKRVKSGDLLLCLGAGDIRATSEELAKIMSEGGN
jgi:UDP-N-acetylmuramate--alanine ligase